MDEGDRAGVLASVVVVIVGEEGGMARCDSKVEDNFNGVGVRARVVLVLVGAGVAVGVGVSNSVSMYRTSSTWRTGLGGEPSVALIDGKRVRRVRELVWLRVWEWEGRLDCAGEDCGELGGARGGSGGNDCGQMIISHHATVIYAERYLFTSLWDVTLWRLCGVALGRRHQYAGIPSSFLR
jgi:hypothetical protein